ncbi:hypothetical protein Tco_1068775 [Tanacetum coccineum]|uniref:Retrotransposon gag domain-containing protein n=1 Tax=Tanacetum coccineum TaxID=301880 RepID=A0ABQ5HGM9_9ASTR
MRELQEDTFFRNKNDDAYEHVERVLDIVSLFNIPGVTHEGVMIHVFPFTLTGATKRWTAKQLEEIHNFKQEGDETLYQAWERYNDLLYKCLAHDINSYQKVKIFYNGLGTMNRQLLDSQGPIPDMTPTQALTAIQTMADHSQKWHHGSSSRNIDSSSNTEGITTIDAKLAEELIFTKNVLSMRKTLGCPNLGELLDSTTHVKVCLSLGSQFLSELGNEKVIFKMRSSFTTIIFESVRAIRSKISTRDDNLVNIDYDLSLYDSEANHLLDIDPNVFTYDIDEVYKITYQGKSCEMETKEETSMELLIGMSSTKNKVHWCEAILQVKEGEHSYWASCNPYKDKCNGGDLTNDEKKLYWKSTNDNERVDLAWE